jgi:hypothetical protein
MHRTALADERPQAWKIPVTVELADLEAATLATMCPFAGRTVRAAASSSRHHVGYRAGPPPTASQDFHPPVAADSRVSPDLRVPVAATPGVSSDLRAPVATDLAGISGPPRAGIRRHARDNPRARAESAPSVPFGIPKGAERHADEPNRPRGA